MILNLNIIDFDEAKKLYNRLDIISENIKKKFDAIEAQVKKLKVELMKSILDDKIEDVRKTSDEIQNLIKLDVNDVTKFWDFMNRWSRVISKKISKPIYMVSEDVKIVMEEQE